MLSERYQPLSPLGTAGFSVTTGVGAVRSTTIVAPASGPGTPTQRDDE